MTKSRKQRGVHPMERARKRTPRRGLDWKRWALVLGALAVFGVVAFLARSTGGTSEDPEVAALARENAGTEIRVLTGSHHTVYHSNAALPSASNPREDGKLTLVWFSGTWCEFCEQMEPWAHATAAQYTDRIVFVEKSVDHDRNAASRYSVRGTPTFVLIDAQGRQLSQFYFQRTAAGFKAAIEQALGSSS